MAQESREGVAGGAQAAALADSIPSRGPWGAHAARLDAAGGPVRLRAMGGPVRPRAAPPPPRWRPGVGAHAAPTPRPRSRSWVPGSRTGKSGEAEGTPRGRPGVLGASPGGASGTLRARNVRPLPPPGGHRAGLQAAGAPPPPRSWVLLRGSRSAGPGGAEAPLRPAGGAHLTHLTRRLWPAPPRAAAPPPAIPMPPPARRCAAQLGECRGPARPPAEPPLSAGGAGRRGLSPPTIGRPGGAGAECDWRTAAWGGTRGRPRQLEAFGLVRRPSGPASSVRAERREKARGPGEAVGGRGAESRGRQAGKEKGASKRKGETMTRRNNMSTMAEVALQCPSRFEFIDE
ncbi:uncharacterized protein [Sagmatias obliquidens]|uniref:uncharacterized protein n=1 Tax=Sagmatias obliquidens TaxID=3371155 RepID=UPI000F443E83|nr:uncharacterized protein LOC113619658 [Lagenorhynchus obliquidens]